MEKKPKKAVKHIKAKLLILAVVAVSIGFLIHDGIGGLTVGVVISRVFDAFGDVFFDRAVDLGGD